MEKYSAVVLCAGSGTRSGLGYNKVLYVYKEKPVFMYAVEAFLADDMCKQIIVVTKEEEQSQFRNILAVKGDRRLEYVSGGKERSDSVAKAIACVREDIVLIHDAARRGIEKADLTKLCTALEDHDAALLGLPIVDTVKRVIDQNVVGTEDRNTLFLAQTPQAFHTEMLRQMIALAQARCEVITDEIMLVEKYQTNAKIKMLRGSIKYNKWTYEEDFGGK